MGYNPGNALIQLLREQQKAMRDASFERQELNAEENWLKRQMTEKLKDIENLRHFSALISRMESRIKEMNAIFTELTQYERQLENKYGFVHPAKFYGKFRKSFSKLSRLRNEIEADKRHMIMIENHLQEEARIEVDLRNKIQQTFAKVEEVESKMEQRIAEAGKIEYYIQNKLDIPAYTKEGDHAGYVGRGFHPIRHAKRRGLF